MLFSVQDRSGLDANAFRRTSLPTVLPSRSCLRRTVPAKPIRDSSYETLGRRVWIPIGEEFDIAVGCNLSSAPAAGRC